MYLTDIRGFSAEDYCIFDENDVEKSLAYGDLPLFAAKSKSLCKITIHGMGFQGDMGLSLHFALFCREYSINPLFLKFSDMGISFFVNTFERERVLDALCEYFPMWS